MTPGFKDLKSILERFYLYEQVEKNKNKNKRLCYHHLIIYTDIGNLKKFIEASWFVLVIRSLFWSKILM